MKQCLSRRDHLDRLKVWRPWAWVSLTLALAIGVLVGVIALASTQAAAAQPAAASLPRPLAPAAPIPPPQGYPKLSLSTKTVDPTLAPTGGETLLYTIEIRNTGATTATNTTLVDTLPPEVTYNGDGPFQAVAGQTLVWTGTVGFDATVVLSFSVDVDSGFSGVVQNTAVISDPHVAHPVTLTAETVVTDDPILAVAKSAQPAKPGANGPLAYTLEVINQGQPATNLNITVVDQVPLSTTLRDVGPDGFSDGSTVTWTRSVDLNFGASETFTFSVDVGDVPSGTIIANDNYAVESAVTGVAAGEPHTVTIVDPILNLSKQVWPDPPGSNREMTYTLTVLNAGSLATDLVITDRVPSGVSYVEGGTEASGVVSWHLPSLDTGQSAQFTFTVYVSDVLKVPIVNDRYRVCSAQEVCAWGSVLTSVVRGPVFEAKVVHDPIAKKPGGGGGPVTPTIVVRNLGPGNALDAQATLFFDRISVQANDLYADPPIGTPPPFPDGPACGEKCVSYVWVGNLAYGQTITFTTKDPQSTIGGDEGTNYTTTVVISDALSNANTAPLTGTAIGKITHYANLVPTKGAPRVVGPGQLLTYTIRVWNSALATEESPPPWLVESVPPSTTLVSVSDGGVTSTLTDTFQSTVISWTLPGLGPGERIARSFSVRVDEDLVSGTQIVNREYRAFWYESEASATFSNTGRPFTTTIQEVGLIDSFKVVTPQLSLPGPNNVLTYAIHLVNSSGLTLTDVTAYDLLPWADSTYRRDAFASSGDLISDIVSIDWRGDIDPFSEVVVTASVVVDPDFEGPLTNTAIISHAELLAPVERQAVAYVTAQPVLFVHKKATPDPVPLDQQLTYRLHVTNLGQQATGLVITDVLPGNVTYVPDSATGGGQRVGDELVWNWSVLEPGEQLQVSFQVTVEQGIEVVNQLYGVRSAEGIVALGAPVTTLVKGSGRLFLPIVLKLTP